MEIIKPAFGLVFWMLISFGIVLFILAKYAWKPILKMIKDRENFISNALEQANKAKEKFALLQQENEKSIAETKTERDKILREAREAATNILADARLKAKEEVNGIMKTARESIHNEKHAAIIELKNQVAAFSIEIAEKILKSELSKETKQKELLEKLIEETPMN